MASYGGDPISRADMIATYRKERGRIKAALTTKMKKMDTRRVQEFACHSQVYKIRKSVTLIYENTRVMETR